MALHTLSTGRQVATGLIPSTRAQLAKATYGGHRLRATTPPAWCYNAAAVSDWTMGGNGPARPNDQSYQGPPVGDCVVCDFANGKRVLSTVSGLPEVEINAKAIVDWYLQATGGQDTGLNILDAEQRLQTVPLYDTAGKAHLGGMNETIDWTNETELRAAISTLKKVTIGVAAAQLLQAIGDTNGWALTGAQTDPQVDHDIFLMGYGAPAELNAAIAAAGKTWSLPNTLNPSTVYYMAYTWEVEGVLDYASVLAIVGEAHAPVTDPDRNDAPVVPPPGPVQPPVVPPQITLAKLLADLQTYVQSYDKNHIFHGGGDAFAKGLATYFTTLYS